MHQKRMILVLAGVLAGGVALSGCGAGGKADQPFTKKQVAACDMDDTKQTELTCLYRADMPDIPYVDVEQYLDLVYGEDSDYTLTGDGDSYMVTGRNKNTGKTGSSLLIDTEKDTMTFEKYDEFVVGKQDGTMVDYVEMKEESVMEDPPLTYDLSRYGIDLHAEEGHVYLPLSTLSDILSRSMTYADYIDGRILLNREGPFSSKPTEYVQELENATFEIVTREKDVADYAYQELCFVLENLYGSPEKAASQEFVKSISSIGLDATLEQGQTINDMDLKLMKTYLTSTNKAEYAQGLFMLDNLLYDGGHTRISTSYYQLLYDDPTWDQTAFAREYRERFGADPEMNVALTNLGIWYRDMDRLVNRLVELRCEGFDQSQKVWEGSMGGAVAELFLFGDMAVFRFDGFLNDVIRTNDGVKPFSEALEIAAENNCKTFVVDLSTNGGGSDQAMGYILSMLYGHDAPYYQRDAETGYQKENIFIADKNLDGAIDEKDEEIRYDFRYAIMISNYTYSCGNTMPNLAHEEGIPLFGATTGGGGCNVFMFTLPGECMPYRISTKWLMTDAAYQSIDGGIAPDEQMLQLSGDEVIDASLYDPDQLAAAIDRYYEKK